MLYCLPGPVSRPDEDPDAKALAWSHVMDAFATALTVPGLHDDDLQRLRRCYRLAARISGRRQLEPVGGRS